MDQKLADITKYLEPKSLPRFSAISQRARSRFLKHYPALHDAGFPASNSTQLIQWFNNPPELVQQRLLQSPWGFDRLVVVTEEEVEEYQSLGLDPQLARLTLPAETWAEVYAEPRLVERERHMEYLVAPLLMGFSPREIADFLGMYSGIHQEFHQNHPSSAVLRLFSHIDEWRSETGEHRDNLIGIIKWQLPLVVKFWDEYGWADHFLKTRTITKHEYRWAFAEVPRSTAVKLGNEISPRHVQDFLKHVDKSHARGGRGLLSSSMKPGSISSRAGARLGWPQRPTHGSSTMGWIG